MTSLCEVKHTCTWVSELGYDPGGGGSENWWGCAAGHWKFDPKRSREKGNLGPKRSNSVRIGSFSTPKDRFDIGGWEKVPQKDRVQSPQCQKRGSKRRHIHITQHRVSTLPGVMTGSRNVLDPVMCQVIQPWPMQFSLFGTKFNIMTLQI